MITVKQLLDALENEIFPDNSTDLLIKRCREREKGIKNTIEIVWQNIQLHLDTPKLDKSQISHWKQKKIERNIQNLLEYLNELVLDLDKEKIVNYLSTNKKLFGLGIPFSPSPLLILLNSYYGTVVTDLYWVDDISVAEAVQISKGNLDLGELRKYTPIKIKEIEILISDNKSKFTAYQEKLNSIKEARICFEKKLYRAFNSVIQTTIEGIVRQLGTFLIEKQKLSINPQDSLYNSLDSFLRKIPWKEDLVISRPKLYLLTGDYSLRDERNILEEGKARAGTITITLKTRLDFLRRRFKENRDMLAHGLEIEYDNNVQAFINACALLHVLKAVIEYIDLYDQND